MGELINMADFEDEPRKVVARRYIAAQIVRDMKKNGMYEVACPQLFSGYKDEVIEYLYTDSRSRLSRMKISNEVREIRNTLMDDEREPLYYNTATWNFFHKKRKVNQGGVIVEATPKEIRPMVGEEHVAYYSSANASCSRICGICLAAYMQYGRLVVYDQIAYLDLVARSNHAQNHIYRFQDKGLALTLDSGALDKRLVRRSISSEAHVKMIFKKLDEDQR